MRRTLLTLLGGLPLLLLLAGLTFSGAAVESAGQRALAKIEDRIGLPVSADRVFLEGADRAGVERLRVGPAEAPLVTVRQVWADISESTRWSLSPWPDRLRLRGVVVHVHGDGTAEGALKALRDMVPTRRPSGGGGGQGRALPAVELDDGRLIDHSGGLEVQDLKVRFLEGQFTGEATVTHPPMGPCTFEGSKDRVRVQCSESMHLSLPGRLQVVGSGLELERGDEPRVTLPGVRLVSTAEDGSLSAMLGGLSADLTVGIEAGADGSRPVRARLSLPGGGQIVGHGRADRRKVEVRADVSGLSLDPVHATVNGQLSGGLTVMVDLEARRAVLEGDARIERFRVLHPALAEGPVGPFNFGIGGRLTVEAPTKNPKKIKLVLEDGRASIGEVGVKLSGFVDNTGETLKVAAEATVPPVDAGLATRAVPPGLLPNLQPFRLAGRFGFKGKLAIDMADLPATVLDADVDLKTLKVEEISDEIGFGRLKRIFYTRFEMPDGEVIVRETGPQSGRWTPLDLIPPLLPLAVTAQEDGGFYRHGGVSMLHLRGSLVRNLERGRFARGGSTLTMQLARNLFLNRRKTLSRKLEELVVTWLLERSFTKDELMELYLNVVEFGDHVFGIGEAARHYFHKAPRDLTPTEIAFLVRLLPSPRFYGKQFERGKVDASYGKRMKALLKRLVQRGSLSAEVAEASNPDLLWNGLQEQPAVPDWEDAPPEGAPPPDDPLDEW